MTDKPQLNPESRARRLQEVHERMVKDARRMVELLGAHDTAGVLLGAVKVVLEDSVGRERAAELLGDVAGRLTQHDGPPLDAQRN